MNLDLKVRKIGNSLGLVLPKEALAHLRVREGDTVTVSEAADGSLRLSPTSAQVALQMAAAQKIMKRYRNTLRELAK